MDIKIQKIDDIEIPPEAIVKVKKLNHIVEVSYIQSKSNVLSKYTKLSKDLMLNNESGELIEVEHAESRKDNMSSLKKSINKMRDIINLNFTGECNELFITLTYKDNMRDYKKLYNDFKNFYKRLKKKYDDVEFKYVYAVEPQARGAWHIHMLLKAMNKDVLYIHNSEIEKLWRQGFTKTERLENVDNVGAYVSSYLINYKDDSGHVEKYMRLYMYPAGINIYRCSKNCLMPNYDEIEYVELKNQLPEKCKTWQSTIQIVDNANNILNTLKKEYYNLKRL